MPFDGTNLTPVTKMLIDGRAAIERGWCQDYFDDDDAVCMLGSLGMSEIDIYSTMQHQAAQALALALPSDDGMDDGINVFDRVAQWNDFARRTKDEVLAVFDDAIARSMHGQ